MRDIDDNNNSSFEDSHTHLSMALFWKNVFMKGANTFNLVFLSLCEYF